MLPEWACNFFLMEPGGLQPYINLLGTEDIYASTLSVSSSQIGYDHLLWTLQDSNPHEGTLGGMGVQLFFKFCRSAMTLSAVDAVLPEMRNPSFLKLAVSEA